MSSKFMKIQIEKSTGEEVLNLTEWLSAMKEAVERPQSRDADKLILSVSRQMPGRTWQCMLNLDILLKTYQDPDSPIIDHPAWIKHIRDTMANLDAFFTATVQYELPADIKKEMQKMHRVIKSTLEP